ncbi:Hypothetical_protein [Hexamita inflata]|uniref:Hypothetical_protein n=1 Tax=Hexamita inflata TaxID=28002 RepID=A0AA86P476_9EUKA|nr:Hypothetical protein HINF_LOCUS17996 [Hexamita inflata]
MRVLPLWKHFLSKFAKKQEKSGFWSVLPWTSHSEQGGLSCLKHLEASSELTLPTDSSLVLLPRSLWSALPVLCLEFSLIILTFSLSLPEFKTQTRFQVSVLNSSRESELLALGSTF